MTQPRSPRDGPLRVAIPGFAGGAGKVDFAPGRYMVGVSVDTRWGIAMPGPREVADLTGIAANFRVIKILKHADTNIAITTDGTTTRVYRKETTWVSKVDQVDGGASDEDITGVATDAVSFKSILAIALGASVAYVFTTATTATGRTWDFTSSTKTGSNSKFANKFVVQVNGRLAPRVTYVRNPNEVYYTEDLTNTDATGSSPSYIGDNATTEQSFTSITEDVAGKLLLGMRHALYSLDGDGYVTRLSPDYPDPAMDAGGQSDRLNFEGPVHIEDRIYYPVQGYDILEYYYGRLNDRIAPRHLDNDLPPFFSLPVNAMVKVGSWLILAMGTGSGASNWATTYQPGGDSRLGAGLGAVSYLWAGRPNGQGGFVWHGSLLTCTDLLRYMWWDEDDSYLYLASGAAESANAQMLRCPMLTDNPLYHEFSSAITLTQAPFYVELGRMDFGTPFDYKELRHISYDAVGLDATNRTGISVTYKVTPDYDSTAYISTETIEDNQLAEIGIDFPRDERFRYCYIRFVATNVNAVEGAYPVLRRAELEIELLPREREARATR